MVIEVLTCAVVAAFLSGCAGDDDAASDPPDDEASIESDVTGCVFADAGHGFSNQSFSQQYGTFSAEVTATPSANPIDAVIGLSDGAAYDFTRLAAIVRFNTSGTVDVRAGDSYRADTAIRYVAGQPYRVRFDVNVRSHLYSVSLLLPSGTVRIAYNYPFRKDQAGVTRLNNVAATIGSGAGFVQACGFTVAPVVLPCKTAVAGSTFTNTTLTRSTGELTLELSATPSASNVDEVIGVTLGAATSYSSYAASIRFAPSGLIEARDGDTYRSNYPITYAGGYTYRFRFVIDIPRHQYTVFVKRPSDTYPLDVGLRLRFRPTQASVTALDNLATIVASASGSLRTCSAQSRASSRLIYAIDLVHDNVLPLPNNELLVRDFTNVNGDNDRMVRLSATGQPLASIDIGGTAAIDAAGNIYIARGEYPGLNLYAYSPTYSLRWTRSLTLSGAPRVHSIGTDTAGNVTVAMAETSSPLIVSIHSFTSAGYQRWSLTNVNADNIAFLRDGFATAKMQDGVGYITRQDSTTRVVWQHIMSWARPGRVTVTGMSADSNGRVFFAGKYSQNTNFSFTAGVPELAYQAGTYDTNSYAVGLSSTGAFLFQRRLGLTDVTSLSSNGTRTVVSGTNNIGRSYPHLLQLDSATGRVLTQTFDTSLGPYGVGGRALINSTGRIFWNVGSQWPVGLYAGNWDVVLQP